MGTDTVIGLPNISVTFKEKAEKAIRSLSRQTVAVILAGESTSGVGEYKSSAELSLLSVSQEGIDFVKRVFEGSYGTSPAKVIVSYADTAAVALLALQPYSFDWLCGYSTVGETTEMSEDEVTADINLLIAEKTEEFRASGKYCKAVVAGTTAPDKEYIVHFTANGIRSGEKTYTAEQYTGRIAGLLASLPLSQSCTYFMLPEVDSVTAKTQLETEQAMGKGELVLINDGEVVRIARGVTSATSEGRERKIKVQRAKDKIEQEIKQAIKDSYIGKYTNTYDNKCLLIAAIKNYFTEIAKQGLIQKNFEVGIDIDTQTTYLANAGTDTSTLSEQEIKEANTGDEVFIAIKLSLLDAMEDFTISISNE